MKLPGQFWVALACGLINLALANFGPPVGRDFAAVASLVCLVGVVAAYFSEPPVSK